MVSVWSLRKWCAFPSLPSLHLFVNIYFASPPAFVCIITVPKEVPKCLPWLVLKTK